MAAPTLQMRTLAETCRANAACVERVQHIAAGIAAPTDPATINPGPPAAERTANMRVTRLAYARPCTNDEIESCRGVDHTSTPAIRSPLLRPRNTTPRSLPARWTEPTDVARVLRACSHGGSSTNHNSQRTRNRYTFEDAPSGLPSSRNLHRHAWWAG